MAAALPPDLQSPQSRSPITYSKVLIVEGHDAFGFFKALVEQLNLLSEIEIRNFGGVDDLSAYLETLVVTRGFAQVSSLSIVRDAEANATSAFQAVCDGLKQAKLDVPPQPITITSGNPKVSVFILPDGMNQGMLETLCLQALDTNLAIECVEQYFDCLQKKHIGLPKNIHKPLKLAICRGTTRHSISSNNSYSKYRDAEEKDQVTK